MFRSLATCLVVLLGVGCATSESAGDDKGAIASANTAGTGGSDPGSESGGAAGLGVAGAATGGAAGEAPNESGGSSSAGGAAGSPPSCAKDEKLCETGCVEKTPEVGCGSWACEPCKSPPANSKAICDGAMCEFECLPGFTRQGFACVGGTGGSGGSGSGGTAGSTGGTGGSGSGGSAGGSTGGTGGGTSVCMGACNPSDPQSQFLCVAACALSGGVGLCAPALNCCVCG